MPRAAARARPTSNDVVEQVLAPLPRARAAAVRDARPSWPRTCPPCPRDRDLLARALGNLVANALEAMPDGGTLRRAHARGRGRRGRIEVADTGPASREEQRTRLFTPYYTTKKGGTGLGLAIVQGIVSDHGGRDRGRERARPGHRRFTLLPARRAPAREPVRSSTDA